MFCFVQLGSVASCQVSAVKFSQVALRYVLLSRVLAVKLGSGSRVMFRRVAFRHVESCFGSRVGVCLVLSSQGELCLV